MKKRLGIVTAVFVMAAVLISGLALSGCEVLPEILGALLKTEDGFFTESIVYKTASGNNRSTYSFGADGTYEYTEESYEDAGEDRDRDGTDGEGWVIIRGYQGTYTWDPETMECVYTYTKEIVDGEWSVLADNETYNRAMYFAEHQFGYAALPSEDVENTWEQNYTHSIQNGATQSYSSATTFDLDESNFSMTYESTVTDADGALIIGEQGEESGTFTIYPEGTEFKEGAQLTVFATTTLSKVKSYDSAAEEWEANWTEDNDQSATVMNIIHCGDFVVFGADYTAMRGISVY